MASRHVDCRRLARRTKDTPSRPAASVRRRQGNESVVVCFLLCSMLYSWLFCAQQVMVVTVNRGSAPHRILAQLSGIQQTTSLVIAFCCEPRLASLIFREAQRLNMLNGDWVWLALEQAVGRWATVPSQADWPLGLLGLVSQQPLRLTKHTMKGSLAILHSAVRASLPVQQLQSWLSSWNATSSLNNSSDLLRLQVAKKLDR